MASFGSLAGGHGRSDGAGYGFEGGGGDVCGYGYGDGGSELWLCRFDRGYGCGHSDGGGYG